MATITALIEHLHTPIPKVAFDDIPDVWFQHADGYIEKSTARVPILKNMDEEMPTLAWDLLPMEQYRAHNWHCNYLTPRYPYASIYTTLGCPYKCEFCMIQTPFKQGEAAAGMKPDVNSYRRWSPETVLNTLDMLQNKYGVHHVKFADELFVLNRKHMTAIAQGIIDRGLDFNIWAYARVDTTPPEILDLLKAAGFNWLCYGFESAVEGVLNDIQKGYDVETTLSCVERTREAGINIGANYIFGLPEDNLETMQATLDQACQINGEYTNFYCTMLYPGSELYNRAIRNGTEVSQDWRQYAQLSTHTLGCATNYLTAGDVLKYRDEAFHHFYERPDFLRFIHGKFGQEAVNHIQSMTKIRLERLHV
jgi:radical SAM superfamily enzyme YgiQ (UPF0313 family)